MLNLDSESPSFLSLGSDTDLGVESTLQELPLYDIPVSLSCTGVEVAQLFEKYSYLPGVILVEQGKFVGMISRRGLLEFLIRPYGQELFLREPLAVLYSYARTEILLLDEQMTILAATQMALRRSPKLLAEPIVVKNSHGLPKLLDVQELNVASWQIRGIETQVRYERSQAQMIQNDKMASLGRLVDGVAHEILDPVGFIWGNLTYVSSYSEGLLQLIAAYETQPPDVAEILQIKEDVEYEFLQQDLPRAIASIRTGAERLKKLVSSLQNFCHIDEVYPKPADLHSAIDGILLLISSRLNGEIEIVKNYGHLPPVYCFLGQLNQVLINIFIKAVDALLNEAVRLQLHGTPQSEKPRIEITTTVISSEATKPDAPDSRWISICIADNGPGMSPELQLQIHKSFSQDKVVDKETSLSVSYRIITGRHGGKLKFNSQLGVGTEFEILLPLL